MPPGYAVPGDFVYLAIIMGMDSMMIAPCGINCSLCRAYIRERKPCPGCRGDNLNKSRMCIECKIKNCEQYSLEGLDFCDACAKYPCERISHLDWRYRTKYGVSTMENLAMIREHGLEEFMKSEEEKWTCPGCGKLYSMHKWECPYCGYVRPK